jgi:peptide-methionine (S)-S-oxide reductase
MKRGLLPFAIAAVAVAGLFVALSGSGGNDFHPPERFPVLDPADVPPSGDSTETATFGSGCFWCSEALFQRVKGVKTVASGFSGGSVANPTYEQVCRGDTGHAEVVQVTFDPKVVSYRELLEVFWRSHDPTTRNRQGNDYGPQYRSVIFYHTDRQRELAERYRKKIDEAGVFANPVVTEIEPFTAFYPADEHHRDYYNRNPNTGYCRAVIGRKLEKLKAVFGDRLGDPIH